MTVSFTTGVGKAVFVAAMFAMGAGVRGTSVGNALMVADGVGVCRV